MLPDIAKVNELVEKMDRAVLVTRSLNGRLVARSLTKLRQAPGADFWLVTPKEPGHTDDLLLDPQVNVTFFRTKTGEWLSVAGVAKVARAPSRALRIGVDVRTVVSKEKDMSAPRVLFELPKDTGEPTNLGRMEYVSRASGEHI